MGLEIYAGLIKGFVVLLLIIDQWEYLRMGIKKTGVQTGLNQIQPADSL